MATSTHTCTRSLKTQYVIGCHASEHGVRDLCTVSAYAAGQFDALAHGHCGGGAEVEQLEGREPQGIAQARLQVKARAEVGVQYVVEGAACGNDTHRKTHGKGTVAHIQRIEAGRRACQLAHSRPSRALPSEELKRG